MTSIKPSSKYPTPDPYSDSKDVQTPPMTPNKASAGSKSELWQQFTSPSSISHNSAQYPITPYTQIGRDTAAAKSYSHIPDCAAPRLSQDCVLIPDVGVAFKKDAWWFMIRGYTVRDNNLNEITMEQLGAQFDPRGTADKVYVRRCLWSTLPDDAWRYHKQIAQPGMDVGLMGKLSTTHRFTYIYH
jgi:hypothetical protein